MTARMTVRHRLAATTAALAAGVVVVLLISVPGAFGAYTAKLTNSANTVTTAAYLTCTAASTGLGAALAWPLDDAYVVTTANIGARDVSGNNRTGVYSLTGVAYRQVTTLCPRDLTNTIDYGSLLDGQSGYVAYPTAFAQTNTFSESLWFSTTTTQGGRLIGFGLSPTGASVDYDRMIWMTNTGNLVFGVFPNAYRTIISPGTYNDGKRHHVVATLGATGMQLYVDGAQVASDTTTTTAQTYRAAGMYLRVGYDNLATWPYQPTSYYFGGSVRFADYFTTTLTPTQVNQLYLAGSGT